MRLLSTPKLETSVQSAIPTLVDVAAAGSGGLPDDLPHSSYDLLHRSAERFDDRRAISFATVHSHRQTTVLSDRDLFAEMTRAALAPFTLTYTLT